MNWKLIFQLSLFGLAMGIATVFVIPSRIEPVFWLVIFVICAYVIAKRCSRGYFLHTNHRQEAAMMSSMPLPNSPRTMMALMGPVVGLASGVILGLFSVAAHKIMGGRAKRR